MPDIGTLIDELLTRDLLSNTRANLEGFRAEHAAGTLAEDDARYIRALHERVVLGVAAKPAVAGDEDAEDDAAAGAMRTELEELRSANDELRRSVAALVAERDQLQATVADLQRELAALKPATPAV